MTLRTFKKWLRENNITLLMDSISATRETKTLYDMGFKPVTYEDEVMFNTFKHIGSIENHLTIIYKDKEIKIDYFCNGDFINQAKEEIEKAISKKE